MKKIQSIAATFCMTAFLALGCGGELAKKVDGFADEACACKDRACLEKVQTKFMEQMKDAKEPSKSDQESIAKSMKRMGDCIAKLEISPAG